MSTMKKTIFHRAFSGSERLWKVFWFLWVPFVILVVSARRGFSAMVPGDVLSSSHSLSCLLSLGVGICTTWFLIALWKCSSNVKFRVFFWVGRAYVVIRFMALVHAAAVLIQAT
jgi:hypothetical protein